MPSYTPKNLPPAPLPSLGLHHVALGAHDVEAVAAFYRDVLGLPELTRHHTPDGALRSIWLDLRGTILMIEHTDEPHRDVQGIGNGPFLLALSIEAGARTTCETRLKAAGYAVESRSAYSLYLRDPEGNRVALSHYPHAHVEATV